MMPQQPPQQIDDSMYREQQQQVVRNDWPQQAPQQKPSITKETNSIWPEKLPKDNTQNDKASEHKKVSKEYSEEEEYTEDDNQVESDDVTTETPKKVDELNKYNN